MNVPGWTNKDMTTPAFRRQQYIYLAIWIYLTNPPRWLKPHPGKLTCGFILHYYHDSVSFIKTVNQHHRLERACIERAI